MDEPERVRARVYFDGYNFYYGAFRDKNDDPSPRAPYRWLDLRKFCVDLLPANYDIGLIRYVTTPAFGRSARDRQQTYLDALEAVSGVQVHKNGRFEERTKPRKLKYPNQHQCGKPSKVEVMWLEEKCADVNLASQLLLDAVDGLFDVAVIVSDDSDQQGVVDLIIERFKKQVVVINVRKRGEVYKGASEVFKANRLGYFANNQLDDEITLPDGRVLRRPVSWGGPKP